MHTEAVVVRRSPIAGIESPELRERALPPCGRRLVAGASSLRRSVMTWPRTGSVSPSIAPRARKQRLHIHVDCVDAGNQRTLSRRKTASTGNGAFAAPRMASVLGAQGQGTASPHQSGGAARRGPAGGPYHGRHDDRPWSAARFKDGSDGFICCRRADPPRGDTGSAEEILNHYCVGQ